MQVLRKAATTPKNIYITIPFSVQPKGMSPYHLVSKDVGMIEPYIDTLVDEIHKTMKSQSSASSQPLESLYISGGDPLLMSKGQLVKIKSALEQHFQLTPETEITLRVNPTTVTKDKMREFAEEGVNRVSLGVPAFSDHALSLMDKGFSSKDAVRACQIIREIPQIKERSLEMMYGLPSQSMEDLEMSLKTSMEADPTHLTILRTPTDPQNFLFSKQKYIPTPNEMYDYISNRFTSEGWDHYDVKNLARSSESCCKHNLSFRQNKDFYGFGVGATSFLNNYRLTRPGSWNEYKSFVQNLEAKTKQGGFDERDSFQQFTVKLAHGLRCKFGFNIKEFEAKMLPEAYANCIQYLQLLVNFNLLEKGKTEETFCPQVTTGYLSIHDSMKFILQSVHESAFIKAK